MTFLLTIMKIFHFEIDLEQVISKIKNREQKSKILFFLQQY